MTLRQKTFSSVRWTTVAALFKALLQIAQVIILARLLLPSDFGLIAIVMAVMAFLGVFADAGISNAVIHYQNISREQSSSLYWLNVTMSTILACMLAAASPWLAGWYHEPAVAYLLLLAALAMVVASFAQQLRINAQKELRFAQLAKVEMAAAVCGFATAVISAWLGAGGYAVLLGSVASAIAGCGLAWGVLAQGWRPQFRMRLAEVSPFLRFGGYMIGNNLANSINNQIDVLLGGRLLGAQAMGLYNVPKSLTLNVQMMINPIVHNVGLPVMAKAQHDVALLKQVYLLTMRMTASVNFPVYVAIALYAPEIVHFMLGSQWRDSTDLLRIFAVWGLLRSIGNPVGSLLFAIGKAKRAFGWNLALLLFTGPVVWYGSQFGTQGMALAMTGLMAGLLVPGWYFLIRPSCGASLGEYFVQLLAPLLISVSAGLLSYRAVMEVADPFARISAGVLLEVLLYAGLSWFFNRAWVSTIFELLGRKKPSAPA